MTPYEYFSFVDNFNDSQFRRRYLVNTKNRQIYCCSKNITLYVKKILLLTFYFTSHGHNSTFQIFHETCNSFLFFFVNNARTKLFQKRWGGGKGVCVGKWYNSLSQNLFFFTSGGEEGVTTGNPGKTYSVINHHI